MLRPSDRQPPSKQLEQKATMRDVYVAFTIGMALDVAAIFIGNPYLITIAVLPVALVITLIWLKKPLPWIVLVSVIAANPINYNAPVALNLIFALLLLMVSMRLVLRLPRWIYLLLFIFILSLLGSISNWNTTGDLSTQAAAIGNYIFGPLLLMPLIYSRLQKERDHYLISKAFIFALILPSIIFMYIARQFGAPRVDAGALSRDYLTNISVYRFGNIDFLLTRTQSGILLGALICATLAVVIGAQTKKLRFIALVCNVGAIFLLIVTGSVGSAIAALCGIISIFVVGQKILPIKRNAISLAAFVCVVLAVWIVLPLGIKNYAYSRYEERFPGNTIDLADRTERWKSSFDYLMANPSGRGWGLYVEPIGTYPHNDYISYGIAFGVLSAVLYLMAPIILFISFIKAKMKGMDQSKVTMLLAGVGAVMVLMVNSFADNLSANRWYFNVVWSVAWFCVYAAGVNMHVLRKSQLNG